MQLKRILPGRSAERGVSLVEQVLAALFIGFLILVWVNSIRVTTKGTIQSKNNLRAQNLALSKMEDVKNTALRSSLGSTWSTLTQSAQIKAYLTPQVATIETKSFTWRVLADFANMPLTSTPAALPTTSTVATSNLWIRAEVQWMDIAGAKMLTMTGYATDMRQ